MRKLGRKASAIACDVTDRKAVEAVFKHAVETYKRVHTVVSAGGLVFDTGPLAEFKEEAFRGVIETDVYGFYNTAPWAALSATPKAAVGPGVIDAGMVLVMMKTPTRALLEGATEATPLKRWGEAAEIAEAVAFLACRRRPTSPARSWWSTAASLHNSDGFTRGLP